MLGLTFSSKLDWGSYIISIAKTASKKIGALICSMKFLSPEVALISIDLPISLAWNIGAMSGLVILFAICSMKILSPEVALYLYRSTIQPCMEYCCHIWAVALSCYLQLLAKLQKLICRTLVLHSLPLLNPWLIVEK